MKFSATDKAVLAEMDASGEVRTSDIYEQFTRKWNACEKLVKAGIFKKRSTGWNYVTVYTKA